MNWPRFRFVEWRDALLAAACVIALAGWSFVWFSPRPQPLTERVEAIEQRQDATDTELDALSAGVDGSLEVVEHLLAIVESLSDQVSGMEES